MARQRELVDSLLAQFEGDKQRHLDYLTSHFDRLWQDAHLLSQYLNRTDSILDVGAVPPGLIHILSEHGFTNLTAVDPNAYLFETYFSAKQVNFFNWNIFDESPATQQMDCLCLCEVLEHLTGDVLETLGRLSKLVAPGGYLFVTTPNLRSLSGLVALLKHRSGLAAKMRETVTQQYRRAGSGDRYFGHVREYTNKEVVDLFESLGFELVESRFQVRPNPANRTERVLCRLEAITSTWRLFGKYLFKKNVRENI